MSGLLFVVYLVVTLYLVIERFTEAYGDPVDEQKEK
jgi:hypothetical protein